MGGTGVVTMSGTVGGPVGSAAVELSVLVPAHDVAATLPAQLDALAPQEWGGTWEVVVVDNRSTDATRSIAREYADRFAHVRVVDAPDRSGLCHARAVGVDSARGTAIAICDGDDIVADAWVRTMGDALRDHAVVTGPLEVDRLNPRWLAETRGRPSATEASTWFGCFPLVSGGNLGFRRKVWDEVGGFDDAYVGAEDAEWSLRLARAGIPVHFAPGAVLHYRYRAEPDVLWRQGTRYGLNRPRLRLTVAAAGFTPPPWFAGWRSWAWLAAHLPGVHTPEGRARWAWVAGVRIGHLRGSLRDRTVFL
jgi:glycosyltransferase involved in cell wall biosynthesis